MAKKKKLPAVYLKVLIGLALLIIAIFAYKVWLASPKNIVGVKLQEAVLDNGLVEMKVEITNNTEDSIFLDPNYCDFKLVSKGKTYDEHLCTLIGPGGAPELKPTETAKQDLSILAKGVNKGDKAYIIYGYETRKSSGAAANGNYYVKSNTVKVR